jgi:hypothetical protein
MLETNFRIAQRYNQMMAVSSQQKLSMYHKHRNRQSHMVSDSYGLSKDADENMALLHANHRSGSVRQRARSHILEKLRTIDK